jgi:hypothetical protein
VVLKGGKNTHTSIYFKRIFADLKAAADESDGFVSFWGDLKQTEIVRKQMQLHLQAALHSPNSFFSNVSFR